jgi:hypothetical protein
MLSNSPAGMPGHGSDDRVASKGRGVSSSLLLHERKTKPVSREAKGCGGLALSWPGQPESGLCLGCGGTHRELRSGERGLYTQTSDWRLSRAACLAQAPGGSYEVSEMVAVFISHPRHRRNRHVPDPGHRSRSSGRDLGRDSRTNSSGDEVAG